VAIVVFAAVNTANNLLYMVLSGLLAVLMLSGFLSALNFRFIKIDIRVPSCCYAGEAFPISVRVQNEKRFFPSLSLQFKPPEDSAIRFSTFYVPVVHAENEWSQTGQAMIKRRGLYNVNGVQASSTYPFGFFSKQRNYRAAGECICYPEIIPQRE